MRSDIAPGSVPRLRASDHAARRQGSELQDGIRWSSFSAAGLLRKTASSTKGVQLHRGSAGCAGWCDEHEHHQGTNERSGHWPFLSDTRRIVQKDLDIAEYTDPVHNPMIPHVIVLEPGLVIYKVYMGYWFFGRPTLEELRQDLRAVTKKCRPDWDITTPELKAAWQQGRKELFYPYGKTFVQTLGEEA